MTEAVEKSSSLLKDVAVITDKSDNVAKKLDVIHALIFGEGSPSPDEKPAESMIINIRRTDANLNIANEIADIIIRKLKGGE